MRTDFVLFKKKKKKKSPIKHLIKSQSPIAPGFLHQRHTVNRKPVGMIGFQIVPYISFSGGCAIVSGNREALSYVLKVLRIAYWIHFFA